MLINHLSIRLKAMVIHLSVSLSIFIITTLVLVYFLYPSIHFQINGGIQGLAIMFWIDMILGPGLTFLVYNPIKKLKKIYFDIWVISILQLSAMIYGFYHIYNQHPVLLILHPASTIETVSYQNLPKQMKTLNLAEFPQLTELPLVSYNPNDKKLQGLVSPVYQIEDALNKQKTIINSLNESQKTRWERLKQSTNNKLWIVQLVGAYQTEWLVLDDSFNQISSLGTTETLYSH